MLRLIFALAGMLAVFCSAAAQQNSDVQQEKGTALPASPPPLAAPPSPSPSAPAIPPPPVGPPALPAEGPVELGSFGAWNAYSLRGSKGRSCYIASRPARSEPAGANRDPVYFFVTHRPQENIRNEISIKLGYTAKSGGKGSLEIIGAGTQKYALVTNGPGAWLENQPQEGAAVESLRKAHGLIVKSTSSRGTNTTDHFSLTGVAQALDRIGQECK